MRLTSYMIACQIAPYRQCPYMDAHRYLLARHRTTDAVADAVTTGFKAETENI